MGHVMLKYTIYSDVICTTGYSKLPKTNISMLAVCNAFLPRNNCFAFTNKISEIKCYITVL